MAGREVAKAEFGASGGDGLYFLIFKALQGGPFEETARVLMKQMEQVFFFKRTDYLGQLHSSNLLEHLARYPNITHSTLERICKQLKTLQNETLPSSRQALDSYLLGGQLSLVRTPDSLRKEAINYTVKSLLSNRLYGPAYKRHSVNIYRHIQASRIRGPSCIRRAIPTEFYARTILYRRIFGHLAPVYCVTFDMSGQYIFTGADDNLIKVWSARDGRLLSTLRGHAGEITDLSVNYENRLLASGSMDKFIRVWDLRTTKMIECLSAHTAMITSVKFAPYNRHGKDRYLISTSNDGSIIFWEYHVDTFGFKKLKRFQERSRPGGQMICSSFSSGGSFLAVGSSDNFIHVYGFNPDNGPYSLKELEQHKNQVDSIQFCNNGFRFLSGSKDGTAVIWTFKNGNFNPMVLNMSTYLTAEDAATATAQQQEPLQVSMVNWSKDDEYVITSLSDFSIKIWNSRTGQLVHVLKMHTAEVYLIEAHPKDPRIFLTGSHDGKVILWDIERGMQLKVFQNRVDGHNNASLYDCKFAPDGSMFVVTDSYGHLSLFGLGSDDPYQAIPDQMFFNYDYRALVRDLNNFVMDEQTHLPPHLMSHLMQLVDMNGAPHPREFQRLVPHFNDTDVVPPLTDAQLANSSKLISHHSVMEDEEFIFEKSEEKVNKIQPMKQPIVNQYMSREVARLLNVYRNPQQPQVNAARRRQATTRRVVNDYMQIPRRQHEPQQYNQESWDDEASDDTEIDSSDSTSDSDFAAPSPPLRRFASRRSTRSRMNSPDHRPVTRHSRRRSRSSSPDQRPTTRRSGRIRRESSRLQNNRDFEMPGPSNRRQSTRSPVETRRSRRRATRIHYFPSDEDETEFEPMEVQSSSQQAAPIDDEETEEDEAVARGETTDVDTDSTEIDHGGEHYHNHTHDTSNMSTRYSARLRQKRKRYRCRDCRQC